MGFQSYLVVLSLVAILFYLLYKFLTKNKDLWPNNGVPLLKMQNMVSRLIKQTNFIEVDQFLYSQMGNKPYGGYMEANLATLLVKDMELIRKIYVKDFEHFTNRRTFDSQDMNFKNMLVNKEDQEWKDLRATMSPTFTTGKIRRMFPIFSESSKKLTTYLKDEIAKDNDGSGIVNLEDILGRYAMDVISSAAFGIESGIFKDPNALIAKMAKQLPFKFNIWLMMKFFVSLFVPKSAKFLNLRFIEKEADEYFTNLLQNSIKYRESTKEKRNDFLQLMIETKSGQLQTETTKEEEMDTYEKDAQLTNKTKIQIDNDLIISNCILFIFGGFDTVNSALMFSAYALALNPEIQEKLYREVEEAVENRGGELTYEDINELEYLEKVINESLRMYPPAVRTERRCTKDYPLDDSSTAKVPKEALVAIPVYQIHHDETHFPKPEVFDPERFSPENKAKRSPYAFMPFGHGPRNCIANRFALTETKAAIANLVMNFEIEPCAKSPVPLKFRMATTLKPENGMWLKLKARK